EILPGPGHAGGLCLPAQLAFRADLACHARDFRREARPTRTTPASPTAPRSEEHTSELQSQSNLVCRLLLEKKKNTPDMDYDGRYPMLQPRIRSSEAPLCTRTADNSVAIGHSTLEVPARADPGGVLNGHRVR